MKNALFSILFLYCASSSAQTLSLERVKKIKSSTVRITIAGVPVSGTGFFITDNGLLLTCFHVISPSYVNKGDSIYFRQIYITTYTGQTYEYGIVNGMKSDTNFAKTCQAFDFAVLAPVKPYKIKMPFLNLGSMENVLEGSEIYTSGYPLTLKDQFLSKGIVAAKNVDSFNILTTKTGEYRMPRNQALLDLTLNPGNSGGAIMKVASRVEEDEVIGIADFIVNPIAPYVASLTNMFQEVAQKGSIALMGIDPVKMYSLFTNIMANTSVGISGCVSINHVTELLNRVR